MDITIVGTGTVGAFYAQRWVDAGHHVTLTFARDRERAGALAAGLGPRATFTPVLPVDHRADAVLLAVRLQQVPEAAAVLTRVPGLACVVLLDAVNPFNTERTGLEELGGRTAADVVAHHLPRVRHVKAFHSLGVQRILDAPGRTLAVYLAGDDPDAVAVAAGLANDAGLAPVLTGGRGTAWLSEPPGELFSQAWDADEAREQLARVLAPAR